MKFATNEEQMLLRRLMSHNDFRHYVNMLWGDYKKTVRAALFAPAAEAEVLRGNARALHTVLTDLGLNPDDPTAGPQ